MIWYIHYYIKYRDATCKSAKGLQGGPLSKRQEWWVVRSHSHLLRNTCLFQFPLGIEKIDGWRQCMPKTNPPFYFKVLITLLAASRNCRLSGWSEENTVSVKVRRAGEATTVLLLLWNNQETQILNLCFNLAFSNILEVKFISFICYTVGIFCNIFVLLFNMSEFVSVVGCYHQNSTCSVSTYARSELFHLTIFQNYAVVCKEIGMEAISFINKTNHTNPSSFTSILWPTCKYIMDIITQQNHAQFHFSGLVKEYVLK